MTSINNVKQKKLIFLIGMPASGKSTIGKLLASKIKANFIDTDSIIEKKEKLTIAEIFSLKGEHYFRQLEFDVLHQLIKDCKITTVVSTGGGMPSIPGVAGLLKKSGLVIWCKTELHILYERIKKSKKRPLFLQDKSDDSIYQKLLELYEKRKSHYQDACHFIIDSSNKTTGLSKIIQILKNSGFQF
jgi:shikimate kinase